MQTSSMHVTCTRNFRTKWKIEDLQRVQMRCAHSLRTRENGLSQTLNFLFANRLSWLGREGSNLRMAVPKTAALPLGDAPTVTATLYRRKERHHNRKRRGAQQPV
jgi:hypothetical protein